MSLDIYFPQLQNLRVDVSEIVRKTVEKVVFERTYDDLMQTLRRKVITLLFYT